MWKWSKILNMFVSEGLDWLIILKMIKITDSVRKLIIMKKYQDASFRQMSTDFNIAYNTIRNVWIKFLNTKYVSDLPFIIVEGKCSEVMFQISKWTMGSYWTRISFHRGLYHHWFVQLHPEKTGSYPRC